MKLEFDPTYIRNIEDLKAGDVFRDDYNVYMKLTEEEYSDNVFNAVNLQDGKLHLFTDGCEVIKVNAKVVISND